MRSLLLCLPLLSLVAAQPAEAQAAAPAEQAALSPEQAAIKAHVAFLASDALRGREAGTPDYDVAAEYVASQMLAAGLTPGGANGSWFQPVPLVAAKPAGEPVMALTVAGRQVPMAFGTDWTIRVTPYAERIATSAPVVFAGYGIVDKASGRDDYRGLDVRGKIVAILYSGPKGLNSEIAAHLGNRLDRARLAKAHGAVGVVVIETSQIHQVFPFEAMAEGWDTRGVTWADAAGKPRDAGVPTLGVLSFAGADKLFAGSKIRWSDVRAADDAGKKLPTGPLAATLSTEQRFTVEQVPSANVVGMLRGSDPALANEVVVLSAHLDHIGVTKPIEGDAINNGALDNAIGIASMLEVAKAFGAAGTRPKRSLLFVAVTAEEKGLIGSDYFAVHPTVPKEAVVANVNLDMPILTYRFVDLVAFGADRSSIGPAVAAAAKARGFALVPDPAPEEADFVRTDHYSFVRQGVPSVSLNPGPGGPGAAATKAFLENNYHQPSDEIGLPIDWQAAEAFVDVNQAIVQTLADAPDRPRWNRGDYFGTLYHGPMAK
ncbi:M28 family peptidase [Sphingomonas desiccabilis]|uniref:M20/M25/M40 family metallo-hydrolase n=1 Tax=Sphingomonas desiccabilis TaxID=429134 RepID=A0A4Q2IT72_9SPHN|nr:M28 family peptidase [Sphingomonas desiccabilis]MBB3911453.1 Zn-dependent M28 family amino/carboxypeptidase [Sphingomonas desiccabilis]RXZ31775.1 M20/M25/M40 family metallo-hydrolase [Sphingomonas desiccabilis]